MPLPAYGAYRLVYNYLGNIDPLTVAAVIDQHLQPLEDCIHAMLASAA